MKDVIGHVADLAAWMDALEATAPKYVTTNDDGERRLNLHARTPSVRKVNGDGTVSALIYARVSPEIVALVDALPGSTVLAQVPTDLADIRGTIDACYAALFADPAAVALYDSVYAPGAPARFGAIG